MKVGEDSGDAMLDGARESTDAVDVGIWNRRDFDSEDGLLLRTLELWTGKNGVR